VPWLIHETDRWTIRAFTATGDALPLPSPAIALDPADARPGAAPGGVTPMFHVEHDSTTIVVELEAGTDVYGTGEVAGGLRRNGARIVCWNTDRPGYSLEDPSLYQSHPWVFAVRADGSAYGVLVDTARRCEIDLRAALRARMGVDGVAPAVYVIEASGPADLCGALAVLTGPSPMPPLWALGYHQSRWSYESAERVLEVAREFRVRSMPCEAIWMDIDYMEGFRSFTFDSDRFSAPRRLSEELHARGFRGVWMIDPGIKVDPEYHVYVSGCEAEAWVRDGAGDPYVGEVWPGECVFPDFTSARVREWWVSLHESFLGVGVDGIWNDMNEPSVFHREDKTMPVGNRHDADPELGGPGTHEAYHNIYGMQMVRATRGALERLRPDVRPFTLTRANFLGGHRYAATWTGDNASTWEHLAWSIPMALNLGLSGQPFAGPDIGGFNGDATAGLFARWMGLGAFLPFARGHTVIGSAPHEPWAFGPGCERTCRLALECRARLLPYLYTLFHEAHRTGLPVVRPLFFADPGDPALRAVDDAFLLGGDLLVRCRVTERGMNDSPMPRGDWREVELARERDDDLPELFVRPGAIVPLGPIVQHTADYRLDPLTLVVNLDAAGGAVGELFEDGWDGYGHLSGDSTRTRYMATRAGGGVAIRVEVIEGDRAPAERSEEALVLSAGGEEAG